MMQPVPTPAGDGDPSVSHCHCASSALPVLVGDPAVTRSRGCGWGSTWGTPSHSAVGKGDAARSMW